VSDPGDAAGTRIDADVDPRNLAATFARDNIPCAVDSDCCLVTDACKNTALVVSALDKNIVTNLIHSADMTLCTGCIGAFVEVSCKMGTCSGTSVDFTSPDAGHLDERLGQDHCGSISPPPAPKHTGTKFGCGG
jgi:hypothetical protein